MIVLLVLVGLSIMMYPFLSNWVNQQTQDRLIQEHNEVLATLSPEDLEAERLACIAHNESLLGTVQLTDPFDPGSANVTSEEYESRLSLTSSGVMGTIDIPQIDIHLPIYHGVSAEVLEVAVGHLPNTSLPVGGRATHAVLSAHSGLPDATLFSNLSQLEIGDYFYLTVLDETLAYEIDQILVVKPTETSSLLIDREKDYVTLVTCTPYGVNTHRLLVRGERVPTANTNIDLAEPPTSAVPNLAFIAVIAAFVVLLVLAALIVRKILSKPRRK